MNDILAFRADCLAPFQGRALVLLYTNRWQLELVYNKLKITCIPNFVGMEVAAYLADKAKSLSVVDIIKVPFQLALGEKVGGVLQKVPPRVMSLRTLQCFPLLITACAGLIMTQTVLIQ